MDTVNLPLNIRILEAKNELANSFRQTGIKYDLPGVVLDLIVSELLADERQAHLALLSEQYCEQLSNTNNTEDKNGNPE